MSRAVISFLMLALGFALSACGDPPPADQIAGSATVDRTDPWEVAHAWIRGWCAGDGAHLAYAFATIPEPEAGLGSNHEGFPQGTPVAEFVSASSGIGGKPGEGQIGFDMDSYPLRVGPRGEGHSMVSTQSARAVRYTIEVRLEDDSVHTVNVLVRPEDSFERHVTVTQSTRWRVVR